MPGYLETESANAMMKAMMLSSSCHDIRGDDTEDNGFKLIVEEDEECNCQIVRALGSGRNTRVRVESNNVLRVDTLTEPALPTGGGIITVNLRAFADPARRFLNFHYSEPIIIINQEGNAVSVPMPAFGSVEIVNFAFVYVSDTNVDTLVKFSDGMTLRPNETLFILDPPMTFTWTENRPRPITVTSRFVRVAQPNLNNWNNQRIYDGSIHILAKYDGNPAQASLNWIPASVIIPVNQVSNQTPPIITLTYDNATGRRSWVREVDELALDRYMFAQSISSGGVATYRESANLLFIHWSQPIQITHVPTSISSTGLISIPIPAVGAQVPNIDATGNAGNIIVRDIGIEVGTNSRALFFDLTNNRLVAVEQGAPISAYNPNASWILICCVSPQDRSLAWIPGKINLPRPETNNSVSYVNSFGTVTWRIQSNLLPATISTSNTISDIQSTSKLLTLTKTDNAINLDSLELEKTLSTYMNRINGLQMAMPPKRFISSVVQFDDLAVLCNSGVQILNSKHITRLRDGILKISFPVPVNSLNYGVLLSMNIKDKVGIIQYAEQAKDFVLVASYDLQGKPTAFSGNFTIEIII